MLNNKKIFITGGAGFLGKALVSSLYEHNEICIYSRDEAKHYFLKKEYPNIRCIVGSITDKDHLIRSARGYNTGIFAASLKQISACDENTLEAIKTICLGSIYSRIASEDNNFESACFISTDKACEATTIYGSCKFTAEQSFIVNQSNVRLTSCRYGNVTNSTGSVIPLILDSIQHNRSLTLFSDKMTRFMITKNEAVDLVVYSLTNFGAKGCVVVPKLKSFLIRDLFEIYQEHKGLKFNVASPRIGEKIHEIMVGKEETSRTVSDKNYLLISPNQLSAVRCIDKDYSSENHVISKPELYNVLKSLSLI
jgi:UDP-N-acetylglucosamine 4,6-dehydratase